MSTTNYKQGDVLLVPFPFTDQSAMKQRPAIVLSEATYNRIHPDLIMAPITSQIKGGADEAEIADWQSAGLLKPGVVKPVLSSFAVHLVRRPLGKLSQKDLARVRSLFARILGLP